ncbi:hypothetical protein WKK05_40550 (plasmid) [Nostoc sp. UHCC 0302]|uniref:hypothetical protein n=1 Tax=Nostoc sp. UHCC 0302 TaxID=3134896 RepID=UPI00311CBD76
MSIFVSNNGGQVLALELPFLTQFQQVYTSLKTRINGYKNEFNSSLGEIQGQLNGEVTEKLNQAVDSTIGSLGIPDPLASARNIKKVISTQNPDLQERDPNVQGSNAEIEWHRQYTLGQSQSTLGTEGQLVQAQEADLTNEALNTSSTNSLSAQSDVITQDILKKMAVQNFQNVIISKAIHGETQKQTRALAAANINLTDISNSMTQESQKEDAQARNAAMQLLSAGAYNDAFWERQ